MGTNYYEGIDYNLWPMFEGVEVSSKDIVLLHIFGSTGQSAIFVTKDDQVYAVGLNVVGFLGIGDIESTVTPIKLDLLCGKFIVGFASGSTHSVAYSKEGELYSWGDNNLGKLGNGTILSRDSPGRVLLPQNVKVIQAACSDRYTIAITSEFKVLHWGDIDWSSGSSQTLPIFLEFPEDTQILNVCCGALHAAALTYDGKVSKENVQILSPMSNSLDCKPINGAKRKFRVTYLSKAEDFYNEPLVSGLQFANVDRCKES